MLNKVDENGRMYKFITHTWNPIRGRCSHNCSYCYMKQIGWPVGESDSHFTENCFNVNLGNNNYIFIGSSIDLFSESIPSEWISMILDYCNRFKNKYFFQSKNPRRFLEFIEHPIIKNSTLCTTIESNRCYIEMGNTPSIEERMLIMSKLSNEGFETYITIEPIMDFDLEEMLNIMKTCNPKQINIGVNSNPKRFPISEPDSNKAKELIIKLKDFFKVSVHNPKQKL